MPRKRIHTPEKYSAPLPSRLRALMDEAGCTQAELANYLGVTRQSVSAYTDGSANLSPDTIVLVAGFFHVSADYLLGMSDIRTTDCDLSAVCNYLGLNERTAVALRNLKHLDKWNDVLSHFLDAVTIMTGQKSE